jgi:hypothetical protein
MKNKINISSPIFWINKKNPRIVTYVDPTDNENWMVINISLYNHERLSSPKNDEIAYIYDTTRGYIYKIIPKPIEDSMVNKKEWQEFRDTGLVVIINQILHIFGWALVFDIDDDGIIQSVFPARVKFRGFGSTSTIEAYKKLSQYMVDNAEELKKEANE